MANGRIAFDDILRGIIGNGNVYFQPPESVKIQYDCIIYEVTDADTKYADNLPYHYTKAYEVTVIYRNPDSDLPNKIAALPMSRFARHFNVDNLNHDVFIVYYY